MRARELEHNGWAASWNDNDDARKLRKGLALAGIPVIQALTSYSGNSESAQWWLPAWVKEFLLTVDSSFTKPPHYDRTGAEISITGINLLALANLNESVREEMFDAIRVAGANLSIKSLWSMFPDLPAEPPEHVVVPVPPPAEVESHVAALWGKIIAQSKSTEAVNTERIRGDITSEVTRLTDLINSYEAARTHQQQAHRQWLPSWWKRKPDPKTLVPVEIAESSNEFLVDEQHRGRVIRSPVQGKGVEFLVVDDVWDPGIHGKHSQLLIPDRVQSEIFERITGGFPKIRPNQ